MIAAMDEDGFCEFATISNLARRAIVTLEEAQAAVSILESPETDTAREDDDGRRIERVPGGWIVLNAIRHRETVTREEQKRLNRERQAKYRKNHKIAPEGGHVTQKSLYIGENNAPVTQSEAEAYTDKNKDLPGAAEKRPARAAPEPDPRHTIFKEALGKYWKFKNPNLPEMLWGAREAGALGELLRSMPGLTLEAFQSILNARSRSAATHSERASVWLPTCTRYLSGPLDRFTLPQAISGDTRGTPVDGWMAGNREKEPMTEAEAKSIRDGIDKKIAERAEKKSIERAALMASPISP